MKALNNFLAKAPLWQVYIFAWFFTGAFTASLFYMFPSNRDLDFSGVNCLKFGASSGLLFGLMFVLMTSMTRKSSEFWTYAEAVEAAIEKANTKVDLDAIFENDFQTLREMSIGQPHIQELARLYHSMKTKYKYVE